MKGGYPPGVFEHTRGAPWNEYETVECRGCARFYYPAERPRHWRENETYTDAPGTDHGREFALCATCETERNVCNECHETSLTTDGAKPRAVDGCAACRADPPCIRCGAPVSVCECNTEPHCPRCGSRNYNGVDCWNCKHGYSNV